MLATSAVVAAPDSERLEREKAERHAVWFDGLHRRISEMREDLRRDAPALSDRDLSLGVDQSHAWLGQILKRRSTNPGAIPLTRLCEAHGYNVRWLVTGQGPRTVNPHDDAWMARERRSPADAGLALGAGASVPPPPPPPAAPSPPPPVVRKKPRA